MGGGVTAAHLNAAQPAIADADGTVAETIPMDEVQPTIGQGTVIWKVSNTDLACCLVAVGIKLRKDPPYTHVKRSDGTEQWTFLFEAQTEDGVLKTGDMIQAFTQDMKWIENKPDHPFTFAMCAVKNVHQFHEHMQNDVPFVGFRSKSGRAIMYVKENSRKHRRAIDKGMIQI